MYRLCSKEKMFLNKTQKEKQHLIKMFLNKTQKEKQHTLMRKFKDEVRSSLRLGLSDYFCLKFKTILLSNFACVLYNYIALFIH